MRGILAACLMLVTTSTLLACGGGGDAPIVGSHRAEPGAGGGDGDGDNGGGDGDGDMGGSGGGDDGSGSNPDAGTGGGGTMSGGEATSAQYVHNFPDFPEPIDDLSSCRFEDINWFRETQQDGSRAHYLASGPAGFLLVYHDFSVCAHSLWGAWLPRFGGVPLVKPIEGMMPCPCSQGPRFCVDTRQVRARWQDDHWVLSWRTEHFRQVGLGIIDEGQVVEEVPLGASLTPDRSQAMELNDYTEDLCPHTWYRHSPDLDPKECDQEAVADLGGSQLRMVQGNAMVAGGDQVHQIFDDPGGQATLAAAGLGPDTALVAWQSFAKITQTYDSILREWAEVDGKLLVRMVDMAGAPMGDATEVSGVDGQVGFIAMAKVDGGALLFYLEDKALHSVRFDADGNQMGDPKFLLNEVTDISATGLGKGAFLVYRVPNDAVLSLRGMLVMPSGEAVMDGDAPRLLKINDIPEEDLGRPSEDKFIKVRSSERDVAFSFRHWGRNDDGTPDSQPRLSAGWTHLKCD